jgi:transmembrane sensor
MSRPAPSQPEPDALCEAAARWIVRRDRGLSAAEAIEFELWLAADPRRATAMRQSGEAWARLDRVPEGVAHRELARAARKRIVRRRMTLAGSLAAAAAFALALAAGWRGTPPAGPATPPSPALLAAGPRMVTLADGTLVRLNSGGAVIEEFTSTERQVRLTRGEAHFTVVPGADRPFVVIAGSVRAEAVGTAFNVNLQATHVEVLVTEGRVRVATPTADAASPPLLVAGERAVVPTVPVRGKSGPAPSVVVSRVDAREMARTLAWHDSLVRLGGATLAELAEEFERRFGERIVIADPDIAQLRAGGRLRADDAENFVSLLAATFDLETERAPDGSRVLRKKTANSP